jgi:predicted amidophosphoribosyltransferase
VVEGGKFCPECGEKLSKVSFCTECGAEQKDGAKFCAECGHKV